MGTSYHLFLLTAPLDGRQGLDLERDTIPFGEPNEIVEELATLPSAVIESDAIRVKIAGVRIDYTLDDAARAITVNGGPWDLLPAVEKLRKLGPLAIYDPQTNDWQAPEVYEPEPPRACPAVFGPPHLPDQPGALGELWSVKHERSHADCSGVVVHDGVVVVPGWRTLTALDAETGRCKWTLQLGRGAISAVIIDGMVVCGGGLQPEVYGIDPQTGRTLWVAHLEEIPTGRAVGSAGRVVVGTADGLVVMLDGATGRPIWQHRIVPRPGHDKSCSVSSLATDGRYVVAGANIGALVCLSFEDGRLVGFRPAYRDRWDDTDASSRSIWAFVAGLVIAGDDVFARDTYMLSRLRLPDLNETTRLKAGLCRCWSGLGLAAGVLLEGAAVAKAPADGATYHHHLRAWDLKDLSCRLELPVPDSAPPPLPLGPRSWAVVLAHEEAPEADRVELILWDPASRAITARQELSAEQRSAYALAAERGLLFLGAGATVTAFRPDLAAKAGPES